MEAILFSCKVQNGFSLFQFKGKTIIKKPFNSTTEQNALLEALKMGYTIGSMDVDSPTFQATLNKMQLEVDQTIDELHSSLFKRDSDGE